MKYSCKRRVYLIIIKDKEDDEPYPFIGDSHEEFLEYYKWFGKNNRIAMSKLAYHSIPCAETIKE